MRSEQPFIDGPGASEIPAAVPRPERERVPEILERIRIDLLHRMEDMIEMLPDGYYTEIKGHVIEGPGVGVWKISDFSAALKNLAAVQPAIGGSGPEVEDLDGIYESIFGGDD